MSLVNSRLTRRSLLAVGAAAGIGGSLVGCSNEGRGGVTANTDAAAQSKIRPSYVRYDGVKPDMSGGPDLPDAFLRYPADPVKGLSAKPGDGKPITVMTQTVSPIPPKLSQNKFWQELNKRVGSPVEINLSDASLYNQKFATAVAGDTLGEIFRIGSVPQTAAMLAAKAVDLTPHLSGDKVKKYPFLANLPDFSWNAAMFGGKLYGIPMPRGAGSTDVLYARKDLLDKRGLPTEVKSGDEFLNLCKELTDKSKNTFAIANVPTEYIQTMYGIANTWKLDGKKLVSSLEDPAQEDVLNYMQKLWKSGYIHPDAFANGNYDWKQQFNNGTCALTVDSFTGWESYLTTMDKGAEIAVLGPPKYDGSGAARAWFGSSANGVTAISKSAEGRVDTLLKYLNFLAAPFGTSEYLFVKFGIEGVDFKRNSQGNPVLTDRGLSEVALGLGYQADAPWRIFLPETADSTKACFEAMKRICTNAIRNPVAGMYSETYNQKGAQILGEVTDVQNDIIQGRQPVSAWAPAVKKWKSSGGDKMAVEYYAAYESSR